MSRGIGYNGKMNDRNRPTDRRGLFRDGASFLGRIAGEFMAAADEARQLVNEPAAPSAPGLDPARGLLRPPGALAEREFLTACTRCDACIKACPEDVLFRAPERLGEKVAGTPTFNPPVKACFLCTPLHCIEACADGALLPPERPEALSMGKARIDPARCRAHQGEECRWCVDFCPYSGRAIVALGGIPVVRPTECVGCGLCEYACWQRAGRDAITTLARTL